MRKLTEPIRALNMTSMSKYEPNAVMKTEEIVALKAFPSL